MGCTSSRQSVMTADKPKQWLRDGGAAWIIRVGWPAVVLVLCWLTHHCLVGRDLPGEAGGTVSVAIGIPTIEVLAALVIVPVMGLGRSFMRAFVVTVASHVLILYVYAVSYGLYEIEDRFQFDHVPDAIVKSWTFLDMLLFVVVASTALGAWLATRSLDSGAGRQLFSRSS